METLRVPAIVYADKPAALEDDTLFPKITTPDPLFKTAFSNCETPLKLKKLLTITNEPEPEAIFTPHAVFAFSFAFVDLTFDYYIVAYSYSYTFDLVVDIVAYSYSYSYPFDYLVAYPFDYQFDLMLNTNIVV